MAMDEKDAAGLLSPAQLVKKYPFVTRSALYSALQSGLLPFFRLPSRAGAKGKYLLAESDFLTWLESNRHGAGAVESVPLVHIKNR